jgi:drug/metabolite transporter (DMT)-like permease
MKKLRDWLLYGNWPTPWMWAGLALVALALIVIALVPGI